MDERYEVFCLADPLFYDSPLRSRGDDVDFDIGGPPAPEGWLRDELDDWLVFRPQDQTLPSQGWKIHASARLENAPAILRVIWDYCLPRKIAFKFIRSRQLLLLRNAKYADRSSSGKFVTIYPSGETELESILTELGALLDGEPGPYVLSDLRWGAGPLYVRYGGFAARWCLDDNGEEVPAVADPDGRLVPDRRGPSFRPPDWVTLPAFLETHRAVRAGTRADALPYRIERALHFSNGGGIYAGVDPATGARVVLKEGRPHAGLAADGSDAVARVRREAGVLERLSGVDAVPAAFGTFSVGEHVFLAMEYVEGAPLRSVMVGRYPLLGASPDPGEVAAYASWAVVTCRRVEAVVDEIHARGVAIRDLHAYNILLGPDEAVRLIDFEVAADVSEERRPSMANPGFLAPPGLRGVEIDRYALACLRLFIFLPITALLGLDPGKARQLADQIADLFPVPREFLEEAVRTIEGAAAVRTSAGTPGRTPAIDADPVAWDALRDSMARAILASATPRRDDRLFPGDIRQFGAPGGGLGLAHGAAGVLYALAATGTAPPADLQEWLVAHALDPDPGTHLGLYDGLHGVAWALDALGRRAEALAVLQICLDELDGKLSGFGLELFGGLAGIGLNLAHFAAITGDPALADATNQVAALVADRLGGPDAVPTVSGGRHPKAGLMRGAAGPALLFLRLFEHSGDPGLLDLAATALRQDLRRCVLRPDGSMHVDEGWRTMPYLAEGSAGIGCVLDAYLGHRHDDRFSDAAAAIRKAAGGVFMVEPGLFSGRAGMILSLSQANPEARVPGADPIVLRHVRNLAWHAVGFHGDLAFPGEELLRLSMDLATGSAGVLLAVGAALTGGRIGLPFLTDPVRVPQTVEGR